jgi:hypothetical protein
MERTYNLVQNDSPLSLKVIYLPPHLPMLVCLSSLAFRSPMITMLSLSSRLLDANHLHISSAPNLTNCYSRSLLKSTGSSLGCVRCSSILAHRDQHALAPLLYEHTFGDFDFHIRLVKVAIPTSMITHSSSSWARSPALDRTSISQVKVERDTEKPSRRAHQSTVYIWMVYL